MTFYFLTLLVKHPVVQAQGMESSQRAGRTVCSALCLTMPAEPTFVEPQPNNREIMVYHSFNVTHPYVAINVEVSVSRPDAQLVVFMRRGSKPRLTQYDWVWKVQLPLNFTVDGQW